MPLLGDKNRFAVEWKVDETTTLKWLEGNVCFWVGGRAIGNYEAFVYLSDLCSDLKYPVGDCGNRYSQTLCSRSPSEAFEMLDRAFVRIDDDTYSLIREEEMWARFNILPGVVTFNEVAMYLLDCQTESRLLVGYSHPNGEQFEFSFCQLLEIGEFDHTIRQLQSELERTLQWS